MTDTSTEAVEFKAAILAQSDLQYLRDTAAILRALLAERDKANEARSEAIEIMSDMSRQAGSWEGIAEGKNVVIRQLEAERDRLREALRRIADRGVETFHINPMGGDNICVEGSDRFAHERDVVAVFEIVRAALGEDRTWRSMPSSVRFPNWSRRRGGRSGRRATPLTKRSTTIS